MDSPMVDRFSSLLEMRSVSGKTKLLFVALLFLPQFWCQESKGNVTLTATESTIRLEWEIQPNATFYMVTWNIGFYFVAYPFFAPFNTSVNGKLSYDVFGMVPGQQYSFNLFQNGNSTDHRVFQGGITTVPLPPDNLKVLDQTSTSVMLAWDVGYNSSQQYYKVEYQEEGTIRTQDTNSTSESLAFNVTGLRPGHTYIITMRAVSNGRTSNSSIPVTAVTAPSSPVNVRASAVGTSRLNISWDPDPNSLQNSYEVWYGTEMADIRVANCSASPCDFVVVGVPGQLYVISVYALQQTVRSLAAIVQHTTAPSAPRNLAGVSGIRRLQLSWDVPSQGFFGSFRVVVTNTQGNNETVFSIARNGTRRSYSYSATGLVGGVNYFVRVFSVTATETSVESISHLYPTLPEPIRNLTGQAINTTSVRLSWLNPASSQYSSLDIQVTTLNGDSDGGSVVFHTLAPGETMLVLQNLFPGAAYTAVATVRSHVGVSSAEVRADFNSKPEMPQLVFYEAQEESIRLNITGGANGIYSSVAATLKEVGTSVTASQSGIVEFISLTPGTEYTLDAGAVSGQENSESLIRTLYTKPKPPTSVEVQVVSSARLLVKWNIPEKGDVDNYTITLVPFHGGADLTKVKVVSDLILNFTEIMAGETYNITVVSNKGSESSAPVLVQETTYPESVAALQKMSATTDSITVNWTAPLSGKFSSFQLAINVNIPNRTLFVSSNDTKHTYTGLAAGTNYSIAIRTVLRNQAGSQVYGEAVVIFCVTRPRLVSNLIVENLGTDKLQIKWAVDTNSTQDHFLVQQGEIEGSYTTVSVIATFNKSAYEYIIDNLRPGYTYNISVTAVREIPNDLEESDLQTQLGTTAPLPVLNVTASESSQLVVVTWQQAAASRQSLYRVRYRPTLRDPNGMWLELQVSQPSTQITGVFPGERYQITIIPVSSGVAGEATNTTVQAVPLPPSASVDTALTTTKNITLKWTHRPDLTFVEHWQLTYSAHDTSQSLSVTCAAGVTEYIQPLTNLTSGLTYAVEVVAIVMGVSSSKIVFNVTTKPVIQTSLLEVPSLTNNSVLTISYRVTAMDVFDEFSFTLMETPDVKPLVKTKSDTDTFVQFSGLTAGSVYTVKAMTFSNGVASDPLNEYFITAPNNVNASFQSTADEILVIFGSVEGVASKYVLRCITPSGVIVLDETVPVNKSSITISNLLPYTDYLLAITTIAEDVRVTQKSVNASYPVHTLEAAPTEVRQVLVQQDGLGTVIVTWDPPVALNGVLRSYRLEYAGSHAIGGNDEGLLDKIPGNQTTIRLTSLKPGFSYTFKVEALTVSLGPPGRAVVTLATGSPAYNVGKSPENSVPTVPAGKPATDSQATIQLVNAFADSNGPIVGYVVVVSKDAILATTEAVLSSWKDAFRSTSVRVYQAIEKCQDLFLSNSACGKSSSARVVRAAGDLDSVQFVLGAQTEDECKTVAYCNGPLEANTVYYVKLRAFTESGFTDTAYSSMIKTVEAPTSANVGAIVGATIGVLLAVIIVAVIAIYIIRHKRRPKRATKHAGHTVDRDRRPVREVTNLTNFSRPVKLIHFAEHVQRMGADSDFKFAEEFEDLKDVGREQTCFAAELPVNRPKNRFTNILPFDHSRVKLLPTDDEEGSDYINANYMPGYSSKREYIATQGPLASTRDDFWRMLWEQNARNIVMLTKCTEKGREKSDHYWPTDSEPKYYGDLQVVILNETHLPDWTITEFRVCLGDNCRQVRHFHYKAWPDFGVPKNHSSLIRFSRMVREKLIRDGGPIITHCSAGVGRSGTFIVLDHGLQLIKEKNEIDVFSIVYHLRRERVLMVQTEQQYKFAHECLANVLEGSEDEAIYANIGQINVAFDDDDEGINVEVPT